jgi:phage virion morphogenesis protein
MPFKNASNGKDMQGEFREEQAKLDKAFKDTIPKKVAQKLGEMASKAFDKEQYPDGKSSPWKKRNKNPDSPKTLVKTGELARSYQDTEINVNGDSVEVVIGSDKVYAQIHNEGLEGNAFGKHAFTMPQRQVIPVPGEELPPDTQQEIDNYIDGIMDNILG